MNKNSLIGIILIGVVLFGWMMWTAPSKEELAARQQRLDSINQANRERLLMDSLMRAQEEMTTINLQIADSSNILGEQGDSIVAAQRKYLKNREKYAYFASSCEGEDHKFMIENDLVQLTFSNKGGFVERVDLKQYKVYGSEDNITTFDPNTARFDLSFFANSRSIHTSQFYFYPYLNGKPYDGQKMLTVPENDSLVFSMRLFADADNGQKDMTKYLEFMYVIHHDDYMIGFDVRTVGLDDVIASNATSLALDWKVDLLQQEKSIDRFANPTVYYRSLKSGDVDHLKDNKDDKESITTRLKWVSFKQRFFSNAIIAKEEFSNAELAVETSGKSKNPRYLKTMSASLELPYDANETNNTIPMSLYFGPNHYKTLKSYGLDLQRQIYLGGFFLIRWINQGVIVVFNWLGSYGWNYGIVILILTILIKVLLFPIAFKSYLSSAKMRVLKPEVDAINAKYPKEEDFQKRQTAVMNLYKQAGANPASGCVPMLLQFPILIAIFRFFPSSIELRQQSFLWAEDLSTYDSILDLPFRIPGYGDHVSLFCLLMTISTVIYTYINNKQMGDTSGQMKGMKVMMYIMPIMFLGIFNSYSAGLSYYYLLANLITFGQMYLFRLLINEDRLRAQMQENKKKPVQKSRFQKRLEEMQKAQMQQQKQASKRK